MAEVRAAKIERSEPSAKRQLYAELCFYYPQYTLKQAQALPARDISLLLSIARKIEARYKYDLTQIVAAPHTKNGQGVKKLLEHFKRVSM